MSINRWLIHLMLYLFLSIILSHSGISLFFMLFLILVAKLYPVGKERIEQVERDVSPVSKEFPVYPLAEHIPCLLGPVIHVGLCMTKHYDLSLFITDEVQFETVQ